MVCAECGAEIAGNYVQCPFCSEIVKLPCGHPAACIRGAADDIGSELVTNYCGWCADVADARQKERARCAALAWRLANSLWDG